MQRTWNGHLQDLMRSLEPATSQSARETWLDFSPVDLELLALAVERAATLVTDDYRLQNLCEKGGVPWLSVTMEGVRALWAWELRCTGCGAVLPTPESPNPSRELGNCVDCGSELGLRRKMD